ncbi:MAG: autotransporter-associated beta strand repeat-containing protein [Verrucomicrobia bacterium]|nr:autotransporter-associated beta strand repeat-containing protein [Verrucomicrobiota bacterium]
MHPGLMDKRDINLPSMKHTHHKSVRNRYALSSALALIASLAFVHSASAATLYWDVDGPTLGFTASPTGSTWGTSTFWSTDSLGQSATANTPTTSTDDVNFGIVGSGFTGAATVSINGTQEVRNITVAGNSGELTLSGGTAINLNAGSTITTTSALNVSTVLTGTNGFTKAGGSYIILGYTGTNGLSGTVTQNAGSLEVRNTALTNADVILSGGFLAYNSSNANAVKSLSFNGGTLEQRNAADISSKFSTAAGQQYKVYTTTDVTFATALTSSGGTFLKSFGGNLTLAAANTFDGQTTVSGGTLILGNSLALQNSAIDTAASTVGTATNGFAVSSGVTAITLGGLSGNSAVNLASLFNTSTGRYNTITSITLNPGTGVTNQYGGAIADGAAGMSLTKTGAGRQIFHAAQTYTGGTTISAGTLQLTTNGSINASSSLTVANGGTFENDGVAFNKALIVAEGALFTGSTSAFTPTSLTITGSLSDGFTSLNFVSALTKSGALTASFSTTAAGTFTLISSSTSGFFDSVTISGTALDSTGGGNFAKSDGSSWNYTFTNSTNTLVISAIPEPSTYAAMAGLGVLLLAATRRRRAQS